MPQSFLEITLANLELVKLGNSLKYCTLTGIFSVADPGFMEPGKGWGSDFSSYVLAHFYMT